MLIDDLLQRVSEDHRDEFRRFVETGEASDDFVTFLEGDEETREALQQAFTAQAQALEGLHDAMLESRQAALAELAPEPQAVGAGATVRALLESKMAGFATAVVYCAPNATVRDALQKMTDYHISQLPVLDGDRNVGAVVEERLHSLALKDRERLNEVVSKVMERALPVVDATEPVETLSQRFSHRAFRRTPRAALVRANDRLVGIVTAHDVLAYQK